MKSATKTPGGFGGEYLSQGSSKEGVSHSVRRKINAQKLEILKGWRLGLRGLLRSGRGLDVYLDSAMEELIEELSSMINSL